VAVLTVGELHRDAHEVAADEPILEEDDVEITAPAPAVAAIEFHDCAP
jgi:hypothetical protein